jgi:hypothetical protein
MRHEERIATLQNWDYSRTQAEFLVYAALGSGYFLRRQFHARSTGGAQTELFLAKLIRYGHATVHNIGSGRRLYHLSHGPMYRALGASGNRNLRDHSAASIKARVMGLDYILSQPDASPLLTHGDKREHFGTRGLAAKDIACGRSPVLTDGRSTTFAYVDSGHRPVGSFGEWLRRHARMFSRLDAFRVVYVCTFTGLSPYIMRAFETAILAARPGDYDRDALDLISYFTARKDFETGGITSVDMASLRQLRDGKERYAGDDYDALYERWKADGVTAIGCGSRIGFETHTLSYKFGAFQVIGSSVSGSSTPEASRGVVADGGRSGVGDGEEVSGEDSVRAMAGH